MDVGGGLYELNTSQSTLGDDTGAIVGLGAPGDGLIRREGISGWRGVIEVETDLALDDTDRGVGRGWTPEAKVVDAVNDGGLAERILAGGL